MEKTYVKREAPAGAQDLVTVLSVLDRRPYIYCRDYDFRGEPPNKQPENPAQGESNGPDKHADDR